MIATPRLSKPELRKLISRTIAPAKVAELIFCDLIKRAIVMVSNTDFSPEWRNAKQLAKECCGWHVCIMSREQLEQEIGLAVERFMSLRGMTAEAAEIAVGEGLLSFEDLARLSAESLAAMSMSTLTIENARRILAQAKKRRATDRDEDNGDMNRFHA